MKASCCSFPRASTLALGRACLALMVHSCIPRASAQLCSLRCPTRQQITDARAFSPTLDVWPLCNTAAKQPSCHSYLMTNCVLRWLMPRSPVEVVTITLAATPSGRRLPAKIPMLAYFTDFFIPPVIWSTLATTVEWLSILVSTDLTISAILDFVLTKIKQLLSFLAR